MLSDEIKNAPVIAVIDSLSEVDDFDPCNYVTLVSNQGYVSE